MRAHMHNNKGNVSVSGVSSNLASREAKTFPGAIDVINAHQ